MKRQSIEVRYADPFSIYVVNGEGNLRRLHTPFRVQCIDTIAGIPRDTWVYVESVWRHPTARLVYNIYNRLYAYDLFRLEVPF